MLICFLSMIDTEEDRDKFIMIYNKYKSLLFYVANNILADPSLSEDVVHQAFIKIIENLDKIENINCHKTKSYIVTIVKHCAINIYNYRKRHLEVPYDEFHDTIADNIEFQEDMGNLAYAVAKLPVIYKTVLTLKFVHNYSNQEIANELEITEATVRKRIERAKLKVQEILDMESV
ncbi:MAG: sigma-70 family RNA polymerase sigma factor [Clostridiaceae bacterium]|nr:sigma-70 family RNA polymerase sigma factor [Clostridiaceae bacterium]